MMGSDDTRRLQEEAFWNSPLDREEQEYEAATDTFVPGENQAELRRMMIESAQSTLVAMKMKKRPVTINLDGEAIAYFKQLSLETGIAYQSLINLFLVQCAKEKKRPVFR